MVAGLTSVVGADAEHVAAGAVLDWMAGAATGGGRMVFDGNAYAAVAGPLADWQHAVAAAAGNRMNCFDNDYC